jgi:hypothetical protein
VVQILEQKTYPEQAYKSILGILSLARKHGNNILNLSCRKACNFERINYHFIKEQAESIAKQFETEIEEKQLSLLPPDHENIRGNQYYK